MPHPDGTGEAPDVYLQDDAVAATLAARDIPVLYLDNDIIVVNKPSGLLVHRGWARDRVVAMTLVRDALGHYVYPVHRLDRSASGAVVMAIRQEVTAPLGRMFEHALVHKTYLALVRGHTPPDGTIDYALPRDPDGVRVEAVTHFRTLSTWERYSLVEARPLQGRLHQIRRHLKHISHPIIGDVRYGKGDHNRRFRDDFGLHRLCLHAVDIAFNHPVTGLPLHIHAPLPDDLAEPYAAMGIWPL